MVNLALLVSTSAIGFVFGVNLKSYQLAKRWREEHKNSDRDFYKNHEKRNLNNSRKGRVVYHLGYIGREIGLK